MERRRRRIRRLVVGVAALAAVAACTPDAPVVPNWVSTGIQRTTSGTTATNFAGAWTDDQWAATIELVGSPSGTIGTVLVSPRSGAGGSVLGTPQRITPTIGVGFPRLMGTHVLSIVGAQGVTPAVEFFRPTAGVWSSIGVQQLPTDEIAIAATDQWLFTRTDARTAGVESVIRVRPIDTTGATVTMGAPVILPPDPAWSAVQREGFGVPSVAADGNLVIVGTQGGSTPAQGALRVFRYAAGVWAPVLTLGGTAADPMNFARAAAVDDGATVDRIAFGPASDLIPQVEVYADTGSGFVHEQTILRDPTKPDDISTGMIFGNALALDGDMLATSSRIVRIPSATPGHADVRSGYVQIYRHGTTWAPEAEVAAFTNPATAGVTSALPLLMQAFGNHIAVLEIVAPDPPAGCTFPCFTFGYQAWSIDRTN